MAGYRAAFTIEEDRSILRFIIDENAFYHLRGTDMWQYMQDMVPAFQNRTWQSLKNRFFKFIVYNLNRSGYNLSAYDIKALQLALLQTTLSDDSGEDSGEEWNKDYLNSFAKERGIECLDSDDDTSIDENETNDLNHGDANNEDETNDLNHSDPNNDGEANNVLQICDPDNSDDDNNRHDHNGDDEANHAEPNNIDSEDVPNNSNIIVNKQSVDVANNSNKENDPSDNESDGSDNMVIDEADSRQENEESDIPNKDSEDARNDKPDRAMVVDEPNADVQVDTQKDNVTENTVSSVYHSALTQLKDIQNEEEHTELILNDTGSCDGSVENDNL